MVKLDYQSITFSDDDVVSDISDTVDDVLDVSHLGPWKLHRDDKSTKVFTFNNTEDDGRPPLLLYIIDGDVIKLHTTAYGSPTVTGENASLARKVVPKSEDAMDWVTNNFEIV